MLVAQIGHRDSAASYDVVAPGGWLYVADARSWSPGAGGLRSSVFVRRATGTEPATATWSFTGPTPASVGAITALTGLESASVEAASAVAHYGSPMLSDPLLAPPLPSVAVLAYATADSYLGVPAGTMGIYELGRGINDLVLAVAPAPAGGGVGSYAADLGAAGAASAIALTLPLDVSAPSVSLNTPAGGVRGSIPVGATASDAGSGVDHVVLQRSPSGRGQWTTIADVSGVNAAATLDTLALADGAYDLRALAYDNGGNGQVSTTTTIAVDNAGPSVAFDPAPAAALARAVTLTANADDAGSGVASVGLQSSPAGQGVWSTLHTASSRPFVHPLDTTTLVDGLYDLRLVATDAVGNVGTSPVLRRRIDNTAPTVSLADPGTPLAAAATLFASADDGGSGVSSVRIERSPAGAGSWTPVAVGAGPSLSAVLDTTALALGSYDVRAVAADAAGNTAGATVASRQVGRPEATPAPAPPGQAPVAVSAPAAPAAGSSTTVVVSAPAGSGTPAAGTRARSATQLSASARVGALRLTRVARVVAAGARIALSGRLSGAAGVANAPLVVRLVDPRWPGYASEWRVRASARGSFTASVPALIGGELRVRFAGSDALAPSDLVVARIAVRPTISARFQSRRGADGYQHDLHVSGRFAPAFGPKVVLRWQAQAPGSARWQAIGTDAEGVRVQSDGRFTGTCHVGPLLPGNRYRLVYAAGVGSPYVSATSPAAAAHVG